MDKLARFYAWERGKSGKRWRTKFPWRDTDRLQESPLQNTSLVEVSAQTHGYCIVGTCISVLNLAPSDKYQSLLLFLQDPFAFTSESKNSRWNENLKFLVVWKKFFVNGILGYLHYCLFCSACVVCISWTNWKLTTVESSYKRIANSFNLQEFAIENFFVEISLNYCI